MALNNSFAIRADASLAEVQAVLTSLSGFRAGEDYDGIVGVLASGVVVDIYSPPLRQYTLEDAGVDANVEVCLSRTGDDWTFNSVRAVMALLHAYPGDALFIYCCDVPALLRKSGHIILDRRAGLWAPGVEGDVISLVDLPYEFGLIPLT